MTRTAASDLSCPDTHASLSLPDRAAAAGGLLRVTLDAAIILYAAAIIVVVCGGRIDLGVVRVSSAAKPLLLLVLLVPVRLALGGRSWVSDRLAAGLERVRSATAALRLPPAVQDALFAVVVTRVAALGIALVANTLLLSGGGHAVALPWPKLAQTFTVFDSAWYVEIARRGDFVNPDGQSSLAFFPLYPLVVRAWAALFGGSEAAFWAAGIAVSWVAFTAALVFLHQLTVRLTGSRQVAQRTVLYVAVFPFSYYFSQVYTESLFLLWTVLAVAAAYDARWARAGLFGGLAALTRPNGIVIAVPLLLMAAAGRPAPTVLAPRLLALAPIPLALGAYSAYAFLQTGEPLAWLGAQEQWGYSIGHRPYAHLLGSVSAIETQGLYAWLTSSETAPIDFFYTLVALLFLALVPAMVRRFGIALGAYVLVSLLIPLSGNMLVGIGRYASVLFPVFILAATFPSTRVQQAILVVSALLYTLFLILFIGWFPLY